MNDMNTYITYYKNSIKQMNKDTSEDIILKKFDMDISKLEAKRDEELVAL